MLVLLRKLIFMIMSMQNSTFFEGSPRDLIHCNSTAKLKDVLKEIPGCELQYKLFSHKRLLRAQRLLGENEVVGR